ncbi:hypothetical protein [Kitasatospora purpeofusca]|uniref:hypothetical protein n=1 Tax=Kitasatospora purpeofusca TaxID=67352 RepID=UPI002A59C6EE|nr:hypothetical protein [Kitasatospora purpeofusca]MDY0816250.1 hypothetical protein [Kitasatospora purpeofusca]
MDTSAFDGHAFHTTYVLDESAPEFVFPTGLVAGCSCGWEGDAAGDDRKGGGHPLSSTMEEDEATEAARAEWLNEHIAEAGPLVPAALADQIRGVGAQIDALIEADQPMAALAAIRLAGGYYTRQARDAALRASYLDNSWAEIGAALGISKQAAWERYGKSRADKAAG